MVAPAGGQLDLRGEVAMHQPFASPADDNQGITPDGTATLWPDRDPVTDDACCAAAIAWLPEAIVPSDLPELTDPEQFDRPVTPAAPTVEDSTETERISEPIPLTQIVAGFLGYIGIRRALARFGKRRRLA